MRDRDVVAALVAGDPDGFAALYDGYAEDLYGYCLSLLGDATDAADAVQDTLIVAAARVGGLRSPDRLCPWLYAVARGECYGRLRSWGRRPGPDGGSGCRIIPGYATEQDILEQLIRGALAGLGPADREAAELICWHELAGPDVTLVLGLPADQAGGLAERSREQLDQALGELLLARTGREECAGLDAVLDAWDGSMSAQWRRRVSAHADSCDPCAMRRFRVLSPDNLTSLAPLQQPPPALRDHVLDVLSDDSRAAAGYRSRVAGRSGPFDPAGFPVPVTPAGLTARPGGLLPAGLPGLARLGATAPGRARVAMGAVAALVLLAGVVGVAASLLGGSGNGATAAGPARRAEPFSLPRGPAQSGPAASASPARSRRPAHSRTPRPSPSASSSHSTRPAASPEGQSSPSPSSAPASSQPPPSSAGLFESPSDILLEQGDSSGESGMFTLIANQGFAVRYLISAPAGSGLSFSAPLSGTVSPGQPLNITVTYTPGAGTSRASGISVNGIPISLTYT